MIGPYLQLLRKRNFFLLWFGQIISQFGDKLTQIALIGFVSRASESSASLAFTISMTIVPVLIFSPISGVYVDRWSKRKTMYICDFLRGILILLIPFCFVPSRPLPLIYFIVFISFSVGRFFIPAKMAFIPQIVGSKDIFLANSLISVTATIAAILGMGLGGIIVDKLGVDVAFIIDAVTFFVSALSVFFITVKEKGKFSPEDIVDIGKAVATTVKISFVKEMKEGIHYIFNSPQTRYAFMIFLFLFSCVGGMFPVFTRFIQEVLHTYTKDLGFIGVALGCGIFAGSLVYGRFAHKVSIKKVINFSAFFSALYIAGFSILLRAYPTSKVGIVLSFIMGLITSPIFVGVNSLLHKESSKELLGRIFGSLEFISHLGFLISMFLFAYLADIFSPFTIMISLGIISSIFALFFIFRYRKE
ncbi:MAG: MFS transporter [Candidatus Omnitrophica bacterium]|nr:MFS transporter [Candidatus Omnitrophota bacterium]